MMWTETRRIVKSAAVLASTAYGSVGFLHLVEFINTADTHVYKQGYAALKLGPPNARKFSLTGEDESA